MKTSPATKVIQGKFDWKRSCALRINTAPYGGHYLAKEVDSLGFEVKKIRRSSIETSGSLDECVLLNLSLRTAFNVLVEVGVSEIFSIKEAVPFLKSIPWESILEVHHPITVTSNSSHPEIRNSMYLNKLVKDVICDRMRLKLGKRPDSGPDREGAVIHVGWFDNILTVWLDTTGKKLTDRGYRKAFHPAPLREGVAAMVLSASGWSPSQPLLVPMCGSGTIAIEAALLGRNRAPGLLRDHYAFKFLKGYSSDHYREIRGKLRKNTPAVKDLCIDASDLSEEAVLTAKKNITTAGTEHFIKVYCCDILDVIPPNKPGVAIVHPEYGARLGEKKDLVETYKKIGEWIRKLGAGWSVWVLSGDAELTRHIHLRSSEKIPLRNGSIECRLIHYQIAPSHSS